MDKAEYKKIQDILKAEMVKALGCTEPISIAFAAAKAREALGEEPESIEVACSGNLIKNAKCVVVPMTGSMKGIETAAIVGAIGGDASKGMEVLSTVTPDDIKKTKDLLIKGICKVSVLDTSEKLHIVISMKKGMHNAAVELMRTHLGIVKITKDGKVTFDEKKQKIKNTLDYNCLNFDTIIEFTDTADMADISPLMNDQIKCNTRIAEEGLKGKYGAQIGKTLLQSGGNDIRTRAKAMAAAGSDARMDGCELPVVINSESGNQGITVSMPVVAYAKYLNVSREKTIRGLTLANLTAIYLKHDAGLLNAFCGTVSAAAGAGAGIIYLYGGDKKQIEDTITNTLGNVSGIFCDGAGESCAAKISASLDAAIMGGIMAKNGIAFHPGSGIIKDNLEETRKGMIEIIRKGMKQTDNVILDVMIK